MINYYILSISLFKINAQYIDIAGKKEDRIYKSIDGILKYYQNNTTFVTTGKANIKKIVENITKK